MGVCAAFLVPLALVTWWSAWTLRIDSRVLHRIDHGLCRACGYSLRGSSDRCPECGKPFRPHEKVQIRRDAGESSGRAA